MKLTDEMKDTLSIIGAGGAVVHLTTCSAEGKPNTVGERFVAVWKDEYILIADMYAQKTRLNLMENPIGVITIAHPVKGRTWAFRGPTTMLQEGLPRRVAGGLQACDAPTTRNPDSMTSGPADCRGGSPEIEDEPPGVQE